MASYNGAKFISKQIESILSDLNSSDELIIVDDFSTDETIAKINKFNDPRIKLYVNGKNNGEIYSFNRAIQYAKNDYIFLSDQDDIWYQGRSDLMINYLSKSSAMLLTSNFSWIDKNDKPIKISFDGVSSAHSTKNLLNIYDIFIGKTNYFGCAMVFKKEFINKICPIPRYVESHDLWIALASNLYKLNMHIDESTFKKRMHDSNATSTVSKRSFISKIYSRIVFVKSILTIFKRMVISN